MIKITIPKNNPVLEFLKRCNELRDILKNIDYEKIFFDSYNKSKKKVIFKRDRLILNKIKGVKK